MAIADQLKTILDRALELHRDYAVMGEKFDHLEKDVRRLIESTDAEVKGLAAENRELRDRVMKLEADFEAAIKGSIKEALIQIAREQKQADGSIPVDLKPNFTRRIESLEDKKDG